MELRDGDESKYEGNGVTKAVHNLRAVIKPRLMESKFDIGTQQREIDDFMREFDAAKDKANLGANAILGISMAVARAGAAAKV